MLQEHAKNYQKQFIELKDSQDEIEQYGRRLRIRIDTVPMVEYDTSNNVVKTIKLVIEEYSGEIPDVAIIMPHQIGKVYTDQTTGVKCKNIIVPLKTFRHRIRFHHNRGNLKRVMKIKLDLTKKHYSIFFETMELLKCNAVFDFVMVVIYCHLKLVLKDVNSNF